MVLIPLDERPAAGARHAASRSPCASDRGCEWITKVARTPLEIERICDETGAPRELASFRT